MECARQPGRQAVATCNLCGKGLCSECAERFAPPLCEACLLSHNRNVAVRFAVELGITLLIAIGIAALIASRESGTWTGGFSLGILVACTYWGWQFVDGPATPFAYTSGGAYAFCAALKIFFAVCLGVFVTPWQIFKRIREILRIRKLEKGIREGSV